MNRFTYNASNQQGEKVSGEIDSLGVTQAVSELEAKGLSVQSIQIVPPGQVDLTDKTIIFHQNVEALLASRPQWMPALEAIAMELPSIPLRQKLQTMLKPLQKCDSATDFLATPDAILLLPICANRLQHESDTHRLHDWLSSLLHLVQMQLRKRRVMIYPIVLSVSLLCVFIVLSYTVFPLFRTTDTDSYLYRARQTSSLLWLSEQFVTRPIRTLLSILSVAALGFGAKKLWSRFALTNRIFQGFVAGSTSNLAAMSILTGTLAELLALKAPLSLALAIAGKTSRHYFFQQATQQLADELASRTPDIKDIARTSLGIRRLPPTLIHALSCSVDGKPSIPLLREISSVYGDRVKRRADWFAAGVPVLAILVLGFQIVFFTYSLIVPLLTSLGGF